MKNFEMIFGKLRKSKSEANLQPNEFTFMIDRKDATFMGSIVNIDGILYENGLSGDGLAMLIRDKAEATGFKFKTPIEAGLFRAM